MVNFDLADIDIPYRYLWDAITDYLGHMLNIVGDGLELKESLEYVLGPGKITRMAAQGISYGCTIWDSVKIAADLTNPVDDDINGNGIIDNDEHFPNKYSAAEKEFAKLTGG